MPSKRHLRRHSSSTKNAPQSILTGASSAAAAITSTTPASSSSSSGSPPSSLLTTIDANFSHSNYTANSSNRNPAANTPDGNSNKNIIGDGGCSPLTQKQLRNVYLATLTKEQLKAECKKRGQKTTGNRTELLQRLGVKMSQLPKFDINEIGATRAGGAALKNTSNSSNNLHQRGTAGNMGSSSSNTNKQQHQLQQTKVNGSAKGPLLPANNNKKLKSQKDKQREEREKLVLWRHPIKTVKYCGLECVTLTHIYGKKFIQHRLFIAFLIVLIGALGVLYTIPGRHQIVVDVIRANTWFVVYWVGLGVLSSVGLGTGLHTFILYLGPHIASVTLAAYECGALNFPKPPYPDDIICPENPDLRNQPNIWNIMAKVRFEAFLWGAGTALGELPPYFMAKAARLSGYDDDDEDDDFKKFEELNKKKESGHLNILDRAKLGMERVVERVGFLGILACASIPNPLFDLAGITCGHFLVPFWTFFGATLIGKAIIKMHIQKIFVIIAFNETLIERAVDHLELLPIFGKRLQVPFKAFLQNQKTRLHRQKNIPVSESGNFLAKLFEKFVMAMICYFVISIVNSMAQGYHKRIHKKSHSTNTSTISNSNSSNTIGKFLKKN